MKSIFPCLLFVLFCTPINAKELVVEVDMSRYARFTVGCMAGIAERRNIHPTQIKRLYEICIRLNVAGYHLFPVEFERYVNAIYYKREVAGKYE